MKYINMDDLTTIIQNRLLIESIEKEEEILAGIEDLVISEVCAYIGGRYDVGKNLVILRSGQVVGTCGRMYHSLSCCQPECNP